MTNSPLSVFNGNTTLTMGSREVAELAQTRHDSVKRTIETLVHKGALNSLPQFVETSFTDAAGKTQWVKEYRLNHRDTMVVVARLNPQFMARVVDRWMELEGQSADPALLERVEAMEAELARLRADKAAQDLARLHSNPRWTAIVDMRAAGRDGVFIAQALNVSRGCQENEVRSIRRAGLGHLLPATALPPVGRKALAHRHVDNARQMSLEV